MLSAASLSDVADLAGNLAWPLVALILVLALRPALTAALERGTLQKVGIGPVSLEFAAATEYKPTAQAAPLIDAAAGPAIPSYMASIVSELEGPTVDYVAIDLGPGERWLTSRLYIFGQLVRRMRGAKAFLFLHTVNPERVFLGSADITTTLGALAQRYPHLEAAFAGAYAQWCEPAETAPPTPPGAPNPYAIVSPDGRLPQLAIEPITSDYIRRLQAPPPSPTSGWVQIGTEGPGSPRIWEHAEWLTGQQVDRLLGAALNTSRVDRSATLTTEDQVKAIVAAVGDFVAVVDADRRFERLIDRRKVLDAVARRSALDD